jgi:hypothetical protein
MIASIIAIIAGLVSLAVYFFNPARSARLEKERVWNEFKDLEAQYRRALAIGDPGAAAQLHKRMRDLRARYAYLSTG